MNVAIPVPRLLPVTIAALASLLAMKSIDVVRAAMPVPGAEATVPAAPAGKGAATSLPRAEQPPPGGGVMPVAAPAEAVPSPAASLAPAAPPAPPAVTDGEKAVLLELRQRRQELDQREATVKARESVLTAAEAKLAGRVEELQTLQQRLEGLEGARRQREDASWQGLVKLYESMKPHDAATIFNELAMPTLLQIVDRMNDRKAASVLAAMNPDKARDVTAQLAQLRSSHDAMSNVGVSGGAPTRPAGALAGSSRTTQPGG